MLAASIIQRSLPDPELIYPLVQEVGLRASRQPGHGLLVGTHVAQQLWEARINAPDRRDRRFGDALFGLAIRQSEACPQPGRQHSGRNCSVPLGCADADFGPFQNLLRYARASGITVSVSDSHIAWL